MDVFITLLSMGRVGWKKLLAERKVRLDITCAVSRFVTFN
jgi:hypothetical protein